MAKRIADLLKLDGYDADLLPEQKIERAEAIRATAGPLVMVGDGVNERPRWPAPT